MTRTRRTTAATGAAQAGSRSILVVGDESTRGKPFFERVWARVLERCTNEANTRNLPELPETIAAQMKPPEGAGGGSTDRPSAAAGGNGSTGRSFRQHEYAESARWLEGYADRLPPLLPKPLLVHAAHDEVFAREIEDRLWKWDVWAVLSAAPSNATERLVKSLVPTGIPLLLAVDSTTLGHRQDRLQHRGVDFSRARPPLLQLVADNAQQASAIYAALQGIRSRDNGRTKVFLWAPDDSDPYVDDLVDELVDRSDTPSADLPIDRIVGGRQFIKRRSVGEAVAIVYVGYDAKELDRALKAQPTVPFLVADGVRREDSEVSRDRSIRRAQTLFFEPTVLFEVCAAQAYEACAKALGTWREEGTRSYAEAVRKELTRRKHRFTSDGANRSGGFVPVGYEEGQR